MKAYPYQEAGADHLLSGRRRYLADEMGLGKTIQACLAASRLGPGGGPYLLIAPASVLQQWQSEWLTWGPAGVPLHSVSYSALGVNKGRYMAEYVAADWGTVIMDEAHYAKNPEAKRTLRSLALARKAGRAWLLSGTPMPNDPRELWPPVRALWPDMLPAGVSTRMAWLRHFCRFSVTDYGIRVHGSKNTGELREILRSFLLRRTTRSVGLDLPPLRITMEMLPAPRILIEAIQALQELEDGAQEALEALESEDTPLATARRLVGSLKAVLIGQRIREELESGAVRKIVVLAYHHDVIEILAGELEGWCEVVTGRTSSRERERLIGEFQGSDRFPVLIGQQGAVGTGVNLQASSEIALVEPSYTPTEVMQHIKRVHRIGQDRPVRARLFAAADSPDVGVLTALKRKLEMQTETGLK